jgi:hypothetical protein
VGYPRRRGGGGRRRLGEAVACAKEDSGEGEEVRGKWRTTRGRLSSRRWRDGGGRAAARGAALPAAGEQNRGHVWEEEEERGGGPGNLFEISRKFKDLSIN